MVKVKICGLKRFEDIEYVNELLPDYAGFVFAKSKRQVTPMQAAELIKRLDKRIRTVGVFADAAVDNVRNTASLLGIDVLQFHGLETPEYIKCFSGYTIWKAVRVEGESHVTSDYTLYDVDALILDSSSGGNFGGTGKTFDWRIVKGMLFKKPLVLAGGLNPSNVREAIKTADPFAVDVSSGVETDGVKDYNKIKKFLCEARGLI